MRETVKVPDARPYTNIVIPILYISYAYCLRGALVTRVWQYLYYYTHTTIQRSH